MENNRPDLLHLNPDQGGPNAGLDAGLKQAARQAYLQNRVDPQLVIVILPVRKSPRLWPPINTGVSAQRHNHVQRDQAHCGRVSKIGAALLNFHGNSAEVPNIQPIVTQCLQGMKIKQERGLDQYCGNISMKIHCKLGGVTHQVRIPALDERTMMIGADVCLRSALFVMDLAESVKVTHPPPKGGAVPPSIVCTVSTTSGANLNMCPSIRLQEGRT